MATSILSVKEINKFKRKNSKVFYHTHYSVTESAQVISAFQDIHCSVVFEIKLNKTSSSNVFYIRVYGNKETRLDIYFLRNEKRSEVLFQAAELTRIKERILFIDEILTDLETNPIN